jgi:hypothetical protein
LENISILYIGLGPKFSFSFKPAHPVFLSFLSAWLKWSSELAPVIVAVGPLGPLGQTVRV